MCANCRENYEERKPSPQCPTARVFLLGSHSHRHSLLLIATAILFLLMLVACGPRTEVLRAVDYTPLVHDDWTVSTPAEQGLNPMLVARLYYDAAKLETLYGLLVIKNGCLIAEKYFNEGSVEQLSGRQSATKS